MQTVERAGKAAVEVEAFAFGHAGQVHPGARRPGADKAAQAVQAELQLPELEIHLGIPGIRQAPYPAVHLDVHVITRVFEGEVFQMEVVDIALYLPLEEGGETDILHALGEVPDGGQGQEGAGPDIGLQPDTVDEFGIVVDGTVHHETVQGQVRFAALQVQSFDAGAGFSHIHMGGRCIGQHKAGVQFQGLQPVHGAGDVVVGHLQLREQDLLHQDGEVVPVDDAFAVNPSFFLPFGRLHGIDHAEGNILHLNCLGTEEFAPGGGLFFLLGPAAQHTVQVHDLSVGGRGVGFEDQVELSAVQFQTFHMGHVAAEEPAQGEFGGEVPHVQDGVRAGFIRLRVFEQDAFQYQGVEGPDGEVVYLHPGRETFLHLSRHPAGQGGLDFGRLHRHHPAQ